MKPIDFASRIVPIDLVDSNFVVSLAGIKYRLTISMCKSAMRADHIALIAREIVARGMAEAMEEAYCHAAAEIDAADLAKLIKWPEEAAQLCRQLAGELHVRELNAKTKR